MSEPFISPEETIERLRYSDREAGFAGRVQREDEMSNMVEPRRAIYREDGGKYLVDVLSDITENGTRTVSWVLAETVHRSPMHPVIEPGECATVTCVKGYEAYVGWELEYEQHL